MQFGCFTPLMHAHGRFEQEAWTYDEETLDALPRATSLLHERLVPYVRAAAATAARCGLPIIRPLALTDPATPRLGDRRRLRLRAVAVGRAGAGGRRARGRGRPAARRLDRDMGPAPSIAGGGEVRRAGAAGPHPGLGPARRDRSSPTRRTHVARGLGRHAGARAAAGGDAVGRAAVRPCRRPAGRRHGGPLDARRVVGHAPIRGRDVPSDCPRDDPASPTRARRRRTRCAPRCPRTCAV